jgi:GNAT superfamily N-acetyltransferase
VLATAGHRVLVAQAPDGAIVGWLHLGCLKWLEGDPRAEIGGLVVDEAHRGERIGERLVAVAIQWAEEEGYREIRVRSNVVRADAHRFYERLGFVRVKVQQVFRRPLGR